MIATCIWYGHNVLSHYRNTNCLRTVTGDTRMDEKVHMVEVPTVHIQNNEYKTERIDKSDLQVIDAVVNYSPVYGP